MASAQEFEVHLLEWKEVHERPESWPPERLQTLLRLLDLDGVDDAEAREMAVMALSEREADEASDCVLQAIFGDRMRAGIRRNLVHELEEDRPWEEFADLSSQTGIFDAVVLLQEAFPTRFGKPDAIAVRVRIGATSSEGNAWLDHSPPMPALLLRILAGGMTERAVLRRLFEPALQADHFPEASSILWTVDPSEGPDSSKEFVLISSHQWFDALEELDTFCSRAHPDRDEYSGSGTRTRSDA